MVEIIRGNKVQKTGYSEIVKSERRLFIELPLEDEIKPIIIEYRVIDTPNTTHVIWVILSSLSNDNSLDENLVVSAATIRESEINDEIKTMRTQSIKSLFNFFLRYFHNGILPIIYPQVNNKVPIIIKTIPNGFAFEKSVKKKAENIDENTNIVITV